MNASKNLLTKTAALVAALTLPLAVLQAAPPPAKAPVPATAPEYHPRIIAAIVALENARVELQMGARDFGGHRVEAIQACDAALAELQLALKYDKK